MASITFKNVTKKYPNGFHAVTNFNLEIKEGEAVVFLGPSGCGKSTTLRMIAGLEEITSGELYIGDKLANDIKPKNRDATMVFQGYALFPYMTAFENIAFGLKPKEFPEAEIRRRVEEIAGIMNCSHLLERKPNELSGGQRQRVALCRALISERKVVLLDEPLSNLDAKLRHYMRAELMKMHQKFAKTFVYVTHDQHEAMGIANRIVLMRAGVIQQVDTPEKLYTHPCNLFTAGFLGTPQMNLWETEITEENNVLYGHLGQLKIPVPKERLAGYLGKEIVIGIRPDDIHIDETGFEVNVKLSIYNGRERQLDLDFGGDFEITTLVSSNYTIKTGDKVKISIPSEKIYLFDKDTEIALY